MLSLVHVTLATGDCRRSPRSEVSQEAIEALRPLVLAGEGELPTKPGFILRVSREGTAAVFTVEREMHERVFPARGRSTRRTPEGWRHRSLAMPSDLPWLGVVLLHGLSLLRREDVGWLGDFERCVAWALIALSRLH